MTCIKTVCDDSPSSLSPRVPGGWKSSRSKSSWLNFPQSYHSCFLCRCQQVYSWWMSKSVTIARCSLTSCMFWNAGLLPLWQVEEFNEKKWVIVATLKWFRQIKPPGVSWLKHQSTLFCERLRFCPEVHSLHSTTQLPAYFSGGSLEDYRIQHSICAAISSLDDDTLLIQQRALAYSFKCHCSRNGECRCPYCRKSVLVFILCDSVTCTEKDVTRALDVSQEGAGHTTNRAFTGQLCQWHGR